MYRGESALFTPRERSDLTYVGRLRGYRDLTEAPTSTSARRSRDGHNDGRGRDGRRRDGPVGHRRDVPLSAAAARDLPARSSAATELIWSRREQPGRPPARRSAYYVSRRLSVRAALVCRRALRPVRARRRSQSLTDKGPSLLLTFWPSEFSQIRGQYRRIEYAEGLTANELLFQFLFSIGAHGAHAF